MPVTTLVTFSVERVEVMDEEGNVDESLMPDLTPERIRALYEIMVLTRRFDERMLKLQRQGRLGTFARVMGQEGAHVGAAFALRDEDWVVPAFREAGIFLLRGMKMEHFLQYWGGDERGNLIPAGVRMLPTAIPVGTHMLHAVGIGWAMKHRGEKVAVLTSFGEGATSEGDFSEAMNFAGVFQAPVVFLCQNNQWAISVPYHKQTAACTVAQKAVGYGMPGVQVDGNDVFAVYRTVSEALERARNGDGPSLIEAHTYRVTDHTTADDARRYRSEEEVAVWRRRDPIARLARYMKKNGLLDDEGEAAVETRADEQVAEAVATFEAMEPPSPEEIFAHVFAEITPPLAEQRADLLRRVGKRG
ncbi:MAG: pyruvate dehydrogenase (acetyl-transferring) E1 component subunit alpha [Actinobacteria bacterium]|nr:pyruvate dehydrogenase (acetyl-transferring) E1 component subunit alpha [Actinomycetota bacterium]